ncbi:anthocyanidin 3-O-glucosyltransferase 5-like [Sesamum indicum]|uniref:Glycosyltransferase n=1 Tax=Sesamum indicum TaxID=4182 RepID=A0A6I9UR70_SESIN|nr:anthocyanidin 3-O-glucosyltransferase 5-like [Sesamum indicum]
MDSSFSNLHVAILSSPGMGHLIPVVVLANRLAAHHNVRVTVLQVTTAVAPPESKLLNLHVHKELVQIIQLPPVDISHLVGPSTQVVTQLCLMVREALPVIRSAIDAMDRRPDALFVDHFGTDALPIAAELNIAKYVYVPSTAWFTALTVYCPVLDQEIEGEYVDQLEDLRIPGCKPIRPEDVVEPMLDRNDQQYDEYVRMGKQIPLSDGILFNSWEDLEPKTIQALRENQTLRSIVNIPVYPIGPLRRPIEPAGPTSELISWLDRQPNESVLFVSFGSGGMLSTEQMTELAWGLELSCQRFIWVVRPPTRGRMDDAYLSIHNTSDDTPTYLPEGFSTRTRDVGLLVPTWAPQVEILSHPAVGGFLSHCGWSSTLESITNGVPMIAWPLYAEQRMNATFLVEEVGVAVRPGVLPTKQVVGREEIERLARSLIEHKEGQRMREKAKQLKLSGMDSLGHGGSSYKSMCEILSKIG